MITIDERDDVKVPTPDANQVTLFYTDQALRFKDENGDVWTLTKQEDLDEIEEAKPKVYRALLTQNGTNAPVATVLENTLGGVPVWSYVGTGNYRLTLAGVFTVNKTFTTFTLGGSANPPIDIIVFDNTSENYLNINSYVSTIATNIESEDSPCKIEILVYP